MDKHTRLLQEAAAAAKACREVAEKADAEGREMTTDERATFDQKWQLALAKKAEADAAKADADVLAQAKSMADQLGLDPSVGGDLDAQLRDPERFGGRKSLGEQIVESAQFKALMGQFPDGRIPDQTHLHSAPIPIKSLINQAHGAKALFTGEDSTSAGAFVVTDRTDIVEMLGRRPLTIRDLVSVRRTASDTVEFVRQTSHTNNAAPVAEATTSAAPTAPGSAGALVNAAGGGYKPEGSWAFEVDDTNVKTIAEWVPASKRALADVRQLEGLINDELLADLAEKEEDQILTGNGSGQNILGILNTSGIQTQAKASDTLFDAVLKARTKARTVGRVSPTGVVVNPIEGEKIALAKDGQGRYFGAGPFALGPNTLWGMPLIESEAIPQGTALLGDFSKAVLWDREQSNVVMTNSHADFFIRNLVAILAEERVAFAVTRPSAFVTVTGL